MTVVITIATIGLALSDVVITITARLSGLNLNLKLLRERLLSGFR